MLGGPLLVTAKDHTVTYQLWFPVVTIKFQQRPVKPFQSFPNSVYIDWFLRTTSRSTPIGQSNNATPQVYSGPQHFGHPPTHVYEDSVFGPLVIVGTVLLINEIIWDLNFINKYNSES